MNLPDQQRINKIYEYASRLHKYVKDNSKEHQLLYLLAYHKY